MILALLGAIGLSMAAGLAMAQDAARVRSPILTIESDRLFSESAYGRRAAQEIEAEGAALAAENRKIEANLNAEEKALTEKRAQMDPKPFRALADAFDAKVQGIRKAQEAKVRKLNQRGDEMRREFLDAAKPILGALMRDTGAAVIVERRSVFLSADVIDVTSEAIARIDAAIGDGSDMPVTPEAAKGAATDDANSGATDAPPSHSPSSSTSLSPLPPPQLSDPVDGGGAQPPGVSGQNP